jgi:hypothetical protein
MSFKAKIKNLWGWESWKPSRNRQINRQGQLSTHWPPAVLLEAGCRLFWPLSLWHYGTVLYYIFAMQSEPMRNQMAVNSHDALAS